MNNGFSHFDEDGNAFMVDVSGKPQTERTATATGYIEVSKEVFDAIRGRTVPKGEPDSDVPCPAADKRESHV